EQTAFAALMGIADADAIAITVDNSPAEQVNVQHVSSNFFQGFGVTPIAGRPFRDDEDRTGQEPAVVVSHRFWMQHLGGGGLDPNVSINSVPVHVVGVAPAGFFGFQAGQWTDVYAPLAARVAFRAQPGTAPRGEDDTDWWVRQIARLKPGSTAAFAQ